MAQYAKFANCRNSQRPCASSVLRPEVKWTGRIARHSRISKSENDVQARQLKLVIRYSVLYLGRRIKQGMNQLTRSGIIRALRPSPCPSVPELIFRATQSPGLRLFLIISYYCKRCGPPSHHRGSKAHAFSHVAAARGKDRLLVIAATIRAENQILKPADFV